MNNDDMASISYRTFNKEEQDEYPSFSICLYSPHGDIFKQSHDVFNSKNVTRRSYYNYLTGYESNYPAQFTTVEFDDVALNIIYEWYLITSWGNCGAYDHGHLCAVDMIPTFRSPEELCVSKNIVHKKNVKQVFDYVALNSSMINMRVYVYVHKKGQLIRSMATEGPAMIIGYGESHFI